MKDLIENLLARRFHFNGIEWTWNYLKYVDLETIYEIVSKFQNMDYLHYLVNQKFVEPSNDIFKRKEWLDYVHTTQMKFDVFGHLSDTNTSNFKTLIILGYDPNFIQERDNKTSIQRLIKNLKYYPSQKTFEKIMYLKNYLPKDKSLEQIFFCKVCQTFKTDNYLEFPGSRKCLECLEYYKS